MPVRPSRLALAALAVLMLGPIEARASDTVAWTCYRNDQYTALATDNVDSVGTKFVTRKSTGSLAADCMIETRPTDVVLGENRPDTSDMNAFYYSMLKDSFLILDDGTGTSRDLVIFDLKTGGKAFSGGYSVVQDAATACEPKAQCGQSDEFSYDDTGLTFWRVTKEAAGPKTCPNFNKLKAAGKPTGQDPVIEEKSLFTFATAQVTPLKGKRCVLRD